MENDENLTKPRTVYSYPAVFQKQSSSGYYIFFPDFEDCYTGADNLAEGITMAEDVLSLMLYEMQKNNERIPEPSFSSTIKENFPEAYGNTVMVIDGDPEFYERYFAEYHPEVV